MTFSSKKDLLIYLKGLKELGSGATSTAYYDKKNDKVYKISDRLIDDYAPGITSFNIEKFNDIQNDTYVFPNEIVYINNEPIGFIMDYVKGKMLYYVNPLEVDLDMYTNASEIAVSDTIKLSKQNISCSDVVFNTMLSDNKIKVIDTDSYDKLNILNEKILRSNLLNINHSLKDFLVGSLFEEFIESNKELNEMYKDNFSNIKDFLIAFRNCLSEYKGKYINTLEEVSKATNKNKRNSMYIRMIK